MIGSRWWLQLLTSVGCLAAVSGCHRQSQSEEASEGTAATPSIPVVHPTRQTITRLIQQPGYIKSYEQTPIYSKIAGYVQEVKVDINDRVHKGDLLLKMWVPEMEQDLKSKEARVHQVTAEIHQAEESYKAAQANVNTADALVKDSEAGILQAEAEYQRWQKEFDRAQRLIKGNVYDPQTRDEMQNQRDQAVAGNKRASAKLNYSRAALVESQAKNSKAAADVEAAKARLQVAEADRDQSKAWLDYKDIRAPYDGVVTSRNVHTGHFLQSASSGSTNKEAQPLFVVCRMDLMRINVQVPEYDAVLLKEGMPAVVRFPSLNLQEFQGKVTRYTWSFDEQARTLRVEVQLPNPQEVLHPGMYAHAVITVQLPDVMTLPTEALMNEGDNIYCYCIEGGKAVRTAVQVGLKNERVTQVLRRQERHIGDAKSDKWEEFSGREEVVARNPASLIDGQTVTASPSAPGQ
jgi:HlyD family secretion protein